MPQLSKQATSFPAPATGILKGGDRQDLLLGTPRAPRKQLLCLDRHLQRGLRAGKPGAAGCGAQKCCPHQCSATSCWGASEPQEISVQLSRETQEVLQAPRAASFMQVLLLLSYTATHSCSKANQLQPVATLTSALLAAILLPVPTPRAAHSSPRRPAAGLRRCCLAIPTCLTSASAVPGMLCAHRPPSRRQRPAPSWPQPPSAAGGTLSCRAASQAHRQKQEQLPCRTATRAGTQWEPNARRGGPQRGRSRASGDVQPWRSKGERGLHHKGWDPVGEAAQTEPMLEQRSCISVPTG